MKLLYLFSFLMLTELIFSQETTVKRTHGYNYFEEYDVLVTDKKIKHGNYLNYSVDLFGRVYFNETGKYIYNKKNGIWTKFQINQIQEQITFKNGERSGEYILYYVDSLNVNYTDTIINNNGFKNDSLLLTINDLITNQLITGTYSKNAKVGLWSYYSISGQPFFQYNYSDSILLFYDRLYPKNSQVLDSLLLREPIYLGGGLDGLAIELAPTIIDQLGLHENAELKIRFQINSKGKLTNILMLDSPFMKLKEKRIIKKIQLKEDWIIIENPSKNNILDIIFEIYIGNNGWIVEIQKTTTANNSYTK